MCGIVGGISKQFKNDGVARLMLSGIKHRGPDGQDTFFDSDKNIFFGHTRLAIIDLSELGKQPMFIKSKKTGSRLWITFNGEIYNYQEIKKELLVEGYEFKSTTDTEVILAAFDNWGVNCVDKFRGMFAFAIWDEQVGEIYLFRDRFGVKPLYYYKKDDDFVFSSELKSIYAFPSFTKNINLEAVALYFQYGYIAAPHTIFNNVYKLEKGSYLKIGLNGSFKIVKYWQPESYLAKEKINISESEIELQLEKLLLDSFQHRLIADVDVGIFLSGGIDSSLVTALLQKNSTKKIKTFTIGFKEKDYDEAPYAKKVAEHLETDHYEQYVSLKDVQNFIPHYGDIFDEPFGDSSSLPTLILSRFASSKVKVALTGDGGDELFVGYSKYKALVKINYLPFYVRRVLAVIINTVGPAATALSYTTISRIFGLQKYSNLTEKISKLSNTLKARSFEEMLSLSSTYWTKDGLSKILINFKPVEEKLIKTSNLDYRERMQLYDIDHYLADDILVKSDRTTMYHGLEGREPFLDQNVWVFMASIDPKIKFNRIGSKFLLKNILLKYLPKDLIDRPKSGFKPPISSWLKEGWGDQFKNLLSVEMIKRQGIFYPEAIEDLVTRFETGKYVNPDKLWLLIAFQLWYVRWMK